jgi:hypothetical protein
MSTDNELDLDKLFLPAWAQESSAAKYSKYEGGEEARFDRHRDSGERRGPPSQGRGPRPGGGRPGGDRAGGNGGRSGQRRDSGRGGPGQDQRGGGRFDQGRGGHRDDRAPREAVAPLPEIDVSFAPDEKGVESLARQIRVSGRAYPLFDIAQMILQKPERHMITFVSRKNPAGEPLQPLFVCVLDDTLWLREEEAVSNVLKKHFNTFYQAERTATEPPKGKYTFVAQCGMSGVILGPPNHHDYQNQLHKLHTERFSRLPFDAFKARVKIVKDEEVVKKWVEDQSWKTEYVCLNMPEPLRLNSMDAVEKHFREVHKEVIIKKVESHTMSGAAAKGLRSQGLSRLARVALEDQRRFPLQIATSLSQQFAHHGLQFFKVKKTITHVSVARPHYLDMTATPVSIGVQRIVEFINAKPRCTRRQLVEGLAPTPVKAVHVIAAPEPTQAPAIPAEGSLPPQNAGAEKPTESAAKPSGPPVSQATPEQTAVIADLHWLIHQGHVIEFANGVLETAKKPIPKPIKPPAKETKPKADQPAATAEEPVEEGVIQGPGSEVAEVSSPSGVEAANGSSPEVSTASETDKPEEPKAEGTETAATPTASEPPK